MNTQGNQKRKGIDLFAALYLATAGFLFLSGAAPFIHGPLAALVEQKPWIHRMSLSFMALSALALFAFQDYRHQCSKVFCRNLPAFSSRRWTWIIFFALSMLWSASAILRHEVFHSGFDMAIFTQAVCNTVYGNFLYSSIKGGISLLGDHFSPLLGILALPYALWPNPQCLLVLQAVAAAACVFPIRALALEKLKNETWAILFIVAFAFYLPAVNAVRFDFHPEILVMPLQLWAFYFLIRNRLWWASFFIALCFLAKENAALAAAGLGLYTIAGRSKRFFGLFWVFFSVIFLWFVTHSVVPFFSGEPYAYLSGNFITWRDLGMGALLKHVVGKDSVFYLFKIFAPLGFLAFLSPQALLLVLPALVQNLAARNEMVLSIFHHYTAFLTPYVFAASICGAAKLPARRLSFYYLAAAVLWMAGVSEWYILQTYWNKWTPHLQRVHQDLKRVPAGAPVRTHEFFAAHLACRKELYIYENHHPREGGSAKAENAVYVVLDRMFLGDTAEQDFRNLGARGYETVFEDDGFRIFKKGNRS